MEIFSRVHIITRRTLRKKYDSTENFKGFLRFFDKSFIRKWYFLWSGRAEMRESWHQLISCQMWQEDFYPFVQQDDVSLIWRLYISLRGRAAWQLARTGQVTLITAGQDRAGFLYHSWAGQDRLLLWQLSRTMDKMAFFSWAGGWAGLNLTLTLTAVLMSRFTAIGYMRQPCEGNIGKNFKSFYSVCASVHLNIACQTIQNRAKEEAFHSVSS
jgi:hypothetical protein